MMSLTHDQVDALTECMNIGVGRAAANLSDMLGTRIELRVPTMRMLSEEATRELIVDWREKNAISVGQQFAGPIDGRSVLTFPKVSGVKLAKILSGDDSDQTELDIELEGILLEVGNIVLNGIMGVWSNLIGASLEYTVPDLVDAYRALTDATSQDQVPQVIMADTQFSVSDLDITGSLVVLFRVGSIQQILSSLEIPS